MVYKSCHSKLQSGLPVTDVLIQTMELQNVTVMTNALMIVIITQICSQVIQESNQAKAISRTSFSIMGHSLISVPIPIFKIIAVE